MTRPFRFLALAAAVFVAGACTAGGGATPSAAGSPLASTAAASCPKSQPATMPAGAKRTVLIQTVKGPIALSIEANLGPRAAGNFVALAACGFYDGLVFHRVVPGFVIQGGDPTGTGRGGPGYQFADDPVTVPYARGVVAMANSGPNTNGSQFFIVVADAKLDPLYSVFGRVTSGMDTVDAIAADADAETPSHPIAMDTVTVSNP